MEYVGFWMRVVAFIIDWLVLAVVGGLVEFLSGIFFITGGTLTLFIYFAYETFFVSRYRATPGKMAIGAVVVKPDGNSLSGFNAFGRAIGKQISAAIAMLGYVMVAFASKKRGLHDFIAGSVVVSRESAPMMVEIIPAQQSSNSQVR